MDASAGFGREMLDHVIPLLIEVDRDGVIEGRERQGSMGHRVCLFSRLCC